MKGFLSRGSYAKNFLTGAVVLIVLFVTGRYNFLLFHSLAEIFSIVIACGIYMMAWNSRKMVENRYLLFVGIAYLFVALPDFIHILSYKGMGVFPAYDANLPTQIWIMGRYMEAVSLLIAPLFIGRRIKIPYIFLSYAVLTAFLFGSIFYWGIFPDCYIEGQGLTPFKITSEYIISMIFAGAIFVLYQKKKTFDTKVFRLLVASLCVTVASELAFTLYIDVYGISNLIGHFLKIISFYLIYKAIIETGLMQPYHLLFRDLRQSEQALRDSRRKYKDLIDTALAGIYTTTDDGRVLFVNHALAAILEYDTPEELLSVDVPSLYRNPELRNVFINRLKTEGRVDNFEIEAVTKTGRIKNLLLSGKIEEEYLSGMVVDITERKKAETDLRNALMESRQREAELRKAEQALSRSKAEFESMFNSIADAVIFTDTNRRIQLTNPAMQSVFGYSGYELKGRTTEILYENPDAYAEQGFLRYNADTKSSSVPYEITYRRRDNTVFIGETVGTHVVDSEGKVIGFIGIVRDITERKQAEKELELHREHLMELVEERTRELQSSYEQLEHEISVRKKTERQVKLMAMFTELNPNPVLRFALNGEVLMANPAAVKILKMNSPNGVHLSSLLPGIETLDLPGCIREERIIPHVTEIKNRCFYFIIKGIPSLNIGHIYGTDITDQKKAEAEAMRASHLASVGELAAGVAHEINNPINGIINYTQILANKSQKGSREHDIAIRIIKEGDRISGIVRDLLSFARESKQEKRPVTVEKIMTDSLSLTRTQLRKDGIHLSVNMLPDLPLITAQPHQIQQVFMNIISNARYALNEKYPGHHEDKMIEISGESVINDGRNYVHITFHDRGTGIPADIMDKIMNPFFTTKPVDIGTGLGLSISHGIISSHGGRITVESSAGEFTRITIILPAADDNSPDNSG